jgi:SAM-dependent methyltransferase
VDDHATRYYDAGNELGRLADWGWLEFARTKELLTRVLPAAPARVLDVGGGPGRYAEWLAELGYHVHLVDPIVLHVDEARARSERITATLGDARSLAEEDGSFDAVLVLGPLYHLTERAERLEALREAGRVLRPGGVLAAAAISRFASLLDGVKRGLITDPAFAAIVERDLREGQHRNPDEVPGWFTTAYLHRPEELADEIAEAGLVLDAVYGIEGAIGWVAGLSREHEPAAREAVIAAARAIEREPSLLGASGHLLAIAHKRSE